MKLRVTSSVLLVLLLNSEANAFSNQPILASLHPTNTRRQRRHPAPLKSSSTTDVISDLNQTNPNNEEAEQLQNLRTELNQMWIFEGEDIPTIENDAQKSGLESQKNKREDTTRIETQKFPPKKSKVEEERRTSRLSTSTFSSKYTPSEATFAVESVPPTPQYASHSTATSTVTPPKMEYSSLAAASSQDDMKVAQAWNQLDYNMMENDDKIMKELEELRDSFKSLAETGLPPLKKREDVKLNQQEHSVTTQEMPKQPNESSGTTRIMQQPSHSKQSSMEPSQISTKANTSSSKSHVPTQPQTQQQQTIPSNPTPTPIPSPPIATPPSKELDWERIFEGLSKTEQALLAAISGIQENVPRIDLRNPLGPSVDILSARTQPLQQPTQFVQTVSKHHSPGTKTESYTEGKSTMPTASVARSSYSNSNSYLDVIPRQTTRMSSTSSNVPTDTSSGASYLSKLSAGQKSKPASTFPRKSWLPQSNTGRIPTPIKSAGSSYLDSLSSSQKTSKNAQPWPRQLTAKSQSSSSSSHYKADKPANKGKTFFDNSIYDPQGLLSQSKVPQKQAKKRRFSIKDSLDFVENDDISNSEQSQSQQRSMLATTVVSVVITSAIAGATFFPNWLPDGFQLEDLQKKIPVNEMFREFRQRGEGGNFVVTNSKAESDTTTKSTATKLEQQGSSSDRAASNEASTTSPQQSTGKQSQIEEAAPIDNNSDDIGTARAPRRVWGTITDKFAPYRERMTNAMSGQSDVAISKTKAKMSGLWQQLSGRFAGVSKEFNERFQGEGGPSTTTVDEDITYYNTMNDERDLSPEPSIGVESVEREDITTDKNNGGANEDSPILSKETYIGQDSTKEDVLGALDNQGDTVLEKESASFIQEDGESPERRVPEARILSYQDSENLEDEASPFLQQGSESPEKSVSEAKISDAEADSTRNGETITQAVSDIEPLQEKDKTTLNLVSDEDSKVGPIKPAFLEDSTSTSDESTAIFNDELTTNVDAKSAIIEDYGSYLDSMFNKASFDGEALFMFQEDESKGLLSDESVSKDTESAKVETSITNDAPSLKSEGSLQNTDQPSAYALEENQLKNPVDFFVTEGTSDSRSVEETKSLDENVPDNSYSMPNKNTGSTDAASADSLPYRNIEQGGTDSTGSSLSNEAPQSENDNNSPKLTYNAFEEESPSDSIDDTLSEDYSLSNDGDKSFDGPRYSYLVYDDGAENDNAKSFELKGSFNEFFDEENVDFDTADVDNIFPKYSYLWEDDATAPIEDAFAYAFSDENTVDDNVESDVETIDSKGPAYSYLWEDEAEDALEKPADLGSPPIEDVSNFFDKDDADGPTLADMVDAMFTETTDPESSFTQESVSLDDYTQESKDLLPGNEDNDSIDSLVNLARNVEVEDFDSIDSLINLARNPQDLD